MNENCPGDSFPPATSPCESDSEPDPQAYRILVANEQATLTIDQNRLDRAVTAILADSKFATAAVSIAVVDDPTIHTLNVQYLAHDYPTDVLSFVLEETADHLEGELVVSADTAIREAGQAGWSPHDELLLYVVHGTLHMVGYDDHDPAEQARMYAAEAHYLQRIGTALPAESSRWLAQSRKDST